MGENQPIDNVTGPNNPVPAQPVPAQPVPETPPADNTSIWTKIAGNKRYGILLALLFIPYFTVEAMKERKAKELDEHALILNDTPNVSVIVNTKNGPGEVQYGDGTRTTIEGHGVVVLTKEDFLKQKQRFGDTANAINDTDFPIVVFWNPSGFDVTSDPLVVRRAADGKVLFELTGRPQLTRLITPRKEGGFNVLVWGSNEFKTVSEQDWYHNYVGVEAPKPIPTQEELDKLSPEELKKLGLDRLTKEEYEKKYGKPGAVEKGKAGLRGMVARVGGNPAVLPLAKVRVLILVGAVAPQQIDPDKDVRIVANLTTDEKGKYEAVNLPAGVYTVLVLRNGAIFGNAVDQATWPTVTLADAVIEYDFRVSQ